MDLPTEAQWEYAARNRGQLVVFATDNGKVEPGRNIPTYEWLEEHNNTPEGVLSSPLSMYEVGLFPPNPLGQYDMVSNGFDWTLDWYDEKYYAKSPERNPTGPATGTKKVQRGNENMEPRGVEMRGMTMVRLAMAPDSKYNSGDHIRCVANASSKIE
jgi:formylglycine-generating enzyme required for sulfatase activity